MGRYYIGIDSGTQSTKTIVAAEDGNVVGRGQAAYDLISGLGAGHKEQDPQTWIDALSKAISAAIAESGINPEEVAAIGVSGQQHGFVPLDSNDEVIRPAKLWCDTSTAAQAEEIMRCCGGRENFQSQTGNTLPAGFTASKILWLKQNEPQNFAKLCTVLLPHDYINFWLTGEKKMEWGDASGTGLLDVIKREWVQDAIAAIDPKVKECLPPLRPSWEISGKVRAEVAKEFGFGSNVIVSAGGGDNMMGAIGTGNVSGGTVTVSLGTSGTIYACSESPVPDSNGEIAAFCDSTGKWLPLLCTMNVTVATELTKQLFDLNIEKLNELAATVAAGADGLMLIPYFEGERVPNVPDGTGVWFGFAPRTNTAGHMARAAMEGAIMGLNYGFNRMKELGIAPTEVRLTGGGSKSSLWRQIAADVFGVETVCTTESESASLGGAIQAKWAIERENNSNASIESITRNWVKLDENTRCRPNKQNTELYRRMQKLHNKVSSDLRESFSAHRELLNS